MDVKPVRQPAVQPTPAPKHTEAAHRDVVRDNNKPSEHPTPKVTQNTPRPVVNTQGQQTGRHLNVSA